MGCGLRTWVDFRHEVARVIAARDAGRLSAVIVWTVNNEAALRELVELGVDGIITDDPMRLQRILLEQGRDHSCTP
jgi:glycerophosphoryl diester phosphodiesterase